MNNESQMEVDRLISIAHLHALNALALPGAERDDHIAVCRGFWKHYAAAFTTHEAECDSFADALEHATRDLMTEMLRKAPSIEAATGFRLSEDSGSPQTLAELRPIFQQIIGQ